MLLNCSPVYFRSILQACIIITLYRTATEITSKDPNYLFL